MAKILIVDDSIVMRKNLSLILGSAGHDIVGEATNGRQAVLLYKELEPDLVTMDISMPILSGVEAVKQIIKEDAKANIIMISAVNQKKMVFNALNNGAKQYIVKPIEKNKVLAIVDEVLQSINEKSIYVEPSEKNIQGFEIENVNGVFIIRFNKHLGTKDHNLLDMAIRGIMFIKPLNVVMDFQECNGYDKHIIDPIMDLAKNIKEIQGNIEFNTSNTLLLERLEKW